MAKILTRVKIEKIGYGGIGLARMSDGKRILIKGGALPGSIVDLKIVKQKKDYIEAHIAHIHELDPKIVDGEVFCPHFFSLLSSNDENKQPRKIGCGGCKWQMLSYANQLKLKEDIVNDSFNKLKRQLPDLQILSIIGSPQEKNYRNKIEFSFGKYITKKTTDEIDGIDGIVSNPSNLSNPSENLVLSDRSVGFHKQGEFSKIIDIDNCGLISHEANIIFERMKELCKTSGLPVYDQMTHQGFFRHLVIREGTNTGQFLLNLAVSNNNLKEADTKKWDDFLENIKIDPLLKEKITSFVITYNNGLADIVRSKECETKTFRGDGFIHEKLIFKTEKSGRTSDISEKQPSEQSSEQSSGIPNNHLESSEVSFRISPSSFFQTNTLGAQQLFGHAMNMVGHVEGTILDLYCGTGSIGISFLKSGKGDKLVGIEIVEEAITDAWHNAKINGIEHQVIFLANPAEKAFTQTPEIKNKLHNLGLVIIDPPRDGLHKNVVQMICDLKKESEFKLLYISCNPITMMRDIELLVQGGFSIKEIQPVDMFPQTHHIECIGVLS